jgi:two-component system cell cycle sensor histidine kinase/response regulator CckA
MALTARNIRPAQDIPAFIEDVAKTSAGVEPRGVWRHYKKDGAVVDVEVMVTDFVYDFRPARLVLANDITERLSLETQLRQVQKMEAIGQFAGGIAHDFNNILTVIQGYSTLLLKRRHDAVTVDQISQVSSAATRGTSLIRQLLAFSRRNVMQFEPTNLNDVVENLTKMLRRLIGEDIVLNTDYEASLPAIMGDVCMLEQILMNLAANSRDAMPEGGELIISTSVSHIDESHVQRYQEARVGDFARITVRDSGCGIPPEILAHLFEPFFTTKDVGKGTGLGLATIYGIVQQHAGWIQVNTAVGVGTEFEVYLPIITNPVPTQDFPSNHKAIAPGKETILLVEDEEPVRGLAHSILEENGYQVIEADCGTAALALWEKRSAEIDLVLTDLIMPGGISGRDLADALRKRRPNLKIVYTSGYSPTRAGQDPTMVNGLKFIPKPYNPDNLLRVIQDCLASAC